MNHQSLKILLVEDNENDYIVVRDMLALLPSSKFEVTWAATYEAAIAKLTGNQSTPPCHYDACLLDYHLGAHTGLEILQHVLAQGHESPIILLTAAGSHDIDRQALEMGAAGFLAKDEITPHSLERAIRYAIRQKQTETSLYQSQQALVETNATLEQQLAAQAAALERAHAREVYLQQLQTRLITSVSHEFRTALMTIQSSADLLEDSLAANEASQRHRFNLIHRSIDRITKTLDNALIYAALMADSIPFKPIFLNPVTICESLVTVLQPIANPPQQLRFINHHYLATPVYLDTNLVQLMLTHVLLNAIRYAPKSNWIQLELDYHPSTPNTGEITFQVSDTGIGIPTPELDKVMDPYYRASNADTIPGTPGVGMGLAIVKRAAALHGGSITLTSTINVGTTVTIALPVMGGAE